MDLLDNALDKCTKQGQGSAELDFHIMIALGKITADDARFDHDAQEWRSDFNSSVYTYPINPYTRVYDATEGLFPEGFRIVKMENVDNQKWHVYVEYLDVVLATNKIVTSTSLFAVHPSLCVAKTMAILTAYQKVRGMEHGTS